MPGIQGGFERCAGQTGNPKGIEAAGLEGDGERALLREVCERAVKYNLEQIMRYYSPDICLECGKDLREPEKDDNAQYLCMTCRRKMGVRCTKDLYKYILLHAIRDMRRNWRAPTCRQGIA